MNPVFVFLVILAAILKCQLLDFCGTLELDGAFKYIGILFDEIFKNIKTEMSDPDVVEEELSEEDEYEKQK